MVSQNLARNIWINAVESEENEKEDLLAKVSVYQTPMTLRVQAKELEQAHPLAEMTALYSSYL